MTVSSNSSNFQHTDRNGKQKNSCQMLLSEEQNAINLDWIRECLNGILVFTTQQNLVYASDDAYDILSCFHSQGINNYGDIPEEILHICQSLIQSRLLFPHQNWLMEFDIVTQNAAIIHIRSRWLKGETLEEPYLILLLEDRQQAVTHILLEEAKKYGFTPREKQVWMLHRNSLTYKQIAKKLDITPNTVKKHMRSIHAKRKQASPAL